MINKTRISYLSILLSISLFSLSANATGGSLNTSSICTKNGVSYGQHGDGHWHKAVKKSGKWYPSGSSLGKQNPCS